MVSRTWTCGRVAHSFCTAVKRLSESKKNVAKMSDVERSVILQSVFVIGSTLAYLLFFRECATPPHIQVCHTTWLSFTRLSPALVLQVTNVGREGLGTRLGNQGVVSWNPSIVQKILVSKNFIVMFHAYMHTPHMLHAHCTHAFPPRLQGLCTGLNLPNERGKPTTQ